MSNPIESRPTLRHVASELSVEAFAMDFMAPNELCVLTELPAGLMAPVTSRWTCGVGPRSPQFDVERFLGDVGAERVVPVTTLRCVNRNSGGPSRVAFPETFEAHCDAMSAGDFVSWVGRNCSEQASRCQHCETSWCGVPYLKDWHAPREDWGAPLFTIPPWFADDWFNHAAFLKSQHQQGDSMRDDYRFVYIGPSGSFTPLHADVLRSYSWSSNICGWKRWRFFPPHTEPWLHDDHGLTPFRLEPCDLLSPGFVQRWPNAHKALDASLILWQGPNQAVFVPSNWFHEVENHCTRPDRSLVSQEDHSLDLSEKTEDEMPGTRDKLLPTTCCLSVNHNWANAYAVLSMWRYLVSETDKAFIELEDCRESCSSSDEYVELCSRLVKANVGSTFVDFLDIVAFFAPLERGVQELLALQSWWEACSPATMARSRTPLSSHDRLERSLSVIREVVARSQL